MSFCHIQMLNSSYEKEDVILGWEVSSSSLSFQGLDQKN